MVMARMYVHILALITGLTVGSKAAGKPSHAFEHR